jgi:hypothetical protein
MSESQHPDSESALPVRLKREEMEVFERLASRGFEALVFLLTCITLLLFALMALYAHELDDFSKGFEWLVGGIVAGFLALSAFVVAHVYPTQSLENFLAQGTRSLMSGLRSLLRLEKPND